MEYAQLYKMECAKCKDTLHKSLSVLFSPKNLNGLPDKSKKK